jgi:GNAT superfamily N-acetyltransferase
MTTIIHSDPSRDLQVLLDDTLPPDLLELLDKTIWGQHGVSFRSLDMAKMLQDLSNPSFMRLTKSGQTVAAAVRNRKQVEIAGTPYDAVHLALFAVHRDFTRQGLGSVLAQVSRTLYFDLLQAPGVLYGYIESGNEASLRLNLGLGYQDMGEIRSRIFSRSRPRLSDRVEVLGQNARSDMLARLKAAYHSHALCSFDTSLDPDRYLVLRRQGHIVAGAQVHVLHWQLLALPGWQGKIAMQVLPHIPLLGREFKPADLRFARVGNLFAEPGSEALISEILETALAAQHLPFAAVLADPRGAVESRILSAVDFGALDHVVSGAFHLIGEFRGVDQHQLKQLSKAPVVISPKDPL